MIYCRKLSPGKPKGPHSIDYETNSQKRSNKQCSRKNVIIKKCAELAIITGGSVFFRFTTRDGRSYVYTSSDEQWTEYQEIGLRAIPPKETRIDSNAKEIDGFMGNVGKKRKQKTAAKEWTPYQEIGLQAIPQKETRIDSNVKEIDGSMGNVGKKRRRKTAAKSNGSTPQGEGDNVITIDSPSKSFANHKIIFSAAEDTEDSIQTIEIKPDSDREQSVPKPNVITGKKLKAKKSKPAEQNMTLIPDETQESFSIQTNSIDVLNPALTLKIDSKYVISAPDLQSGNSNSNSVSISNDEENSANPESSKDTPSALPVKLFPSHKTSVNLQLDPSLVTNGSSKVVKVSKLDKNNEVPPKKKRKYSKRSLSPDPIAYRNAEREDVHCLVCGTQYAVRQDNRRYGRWIGCSGGCKGWTHARCVGWSEADVDDAKKDYFCDACTKQKNEQKEEEKSQEENKEDANVDIE